MRQSVLISRNGVKWRWRGRTTRSSSKALAKICRNSVPAPSLAGSRGRKPEGRSLAFTARSTSRKISRGSFSTEGRLARSLEASFRRSKWKINSPKLRHFATRDLTVWLLRTGVREGGVGENASYYIFTQASDGAFEAFPVEEWYNFQSVQRYKALSIEEAEEEFSSRNKTWNLFSVMVGTFDGLKPWIRWTKFRVQRRRQVRKRMKKEDEDADDGEEGEEGKGKGKKKKKPGKGILVIISFKLKKISQLATCRRFANFRKWRLAGVFVWRIGRRRGQGRQWRRIE